MAQQPVPKQIRVALKYREELGLPNVIPSRGKAPSGEWKRYSTERMTDADVRREFGRAGRTTNYWAPTGVVNGFVVLDVDNEAGEALLREVEGLAELMDSTALVITGSGKRHYWFRLPDGSDGWATWRVHPSKERPDDPSFDVQCNGSGVAIPPSVHPDTGEKYRWERSLTTAVEAPEWLRAAPKGLEGAVGGDGPRSMLTQLLSHPPSGEGSGRNEWVTRVAGHYAKQFRHAEDAYRFHVLQAAEAVVDDTYGLDEVEKTIASIWGKEHSKLAVVPDGADEAEIGGVEASAANGFLISGGGMLLTECTRKDEDSKTEIFLDQWADFDLVCKGVVDDPEAPRSYFVDIHRKGRGDVRSDVLPARDLADTKRITAWLAQHGVAVLPPNGARHRQAPGTRLQLFLESQGAPTYTVLPSYGYDHDVEGYVTPEGIIREDGLHEHIGATPDPGLRDHFSGNFGFASDLDEARRVLKEVLTFHYEEEAAVFGSWWAACLLKPLFIEQSSLFPNFGIEASSGKGKSKGLFGILVELSGAGGLTGNLTEAGLRAMASACRGTILQIDDADTVANLTEVLRASTTEAAISKMGGDNFGKVVQQVMRAPILITGEAIGIHYEKALRDRFVLLKPSDASDRKSKRDRSRSQWDDIVALRRKYPHLNALAGSMVQLAMRHRGQVEAFPKLRGIEGKRHGDKIAVIRTGARVLAGMTGDLAIIDSVDHWVEGLPDVDDSANSLMLSTLPELLSRFGELRIPMPTRDEDPPTPVLVIDGHVYGNSKAIAGWLYKIKGRAVSERTETEQAIAEQADDLGAESKAIRPGKSTDRRLWYWRLPADVSGRIMSLASGDMTGDMARSER